jgi:hypothetical protein
MDVDKHKRLSNITLRHNSTCIAVLHFTRVIGSSTMIITVDKGNNKVLGNLSKNTERCSNA